MADSKKSLNRHLLTPALLIICLVSNACIAQNDASAEQKANPSEAAADTTAKTPEENASSKSGGKTGGAALPPRTVPTLFEQELKQLENLAKTNTKTQWLETEHGKFTLSWSADLSGAPVGALLVLQDSGQTQLALTSLANLHNSLPHFGWAVLSLALLPPVEPQVPQRPSASALNSAITQASPSSDTETQATASDDKKMDESSPDVNAETEKDVAPPKNEADVVYQAPEETTEPPSQQSKADTTETNNALSHQPGIIEDITQARLSEAIQFLHAQGQFNIVLAGQGLGAARALKLLTMDNIESTATENSSEISQSAFQALVLINAKHMIKNDDFAFLQALGKVKIPVLDLRFHPEDTHTDLAKQRKNSAQKALLKVYMSRKILTPTYLKSDKENRLSRAIRGFLQKYARGLEIGQ